MNTASALRAGLAVLLGIAMALAPRPTLAKEPPPVEAFFAEPDIVHAELSPSGRWLAMTTGAGSKRVRLFVVDVADSKPVGVAAGFADVDIGGFHWLNDERLLFGVRDRLRGGGKQRFGSGLFGVARTGGRLAPLILVAGDTGASIYGHRIRDPLGAHHRLLHVPAGGQEVVVGEPSWDGNGDFFAMKAMRLDVETMRTTDIGGNVPDNVRSWMFDRHGQPRLVVTSSDGRGRVAWREGERWRNLLEFAANEATWWPHSIDGDNGLFVTVPSGRGGVRQLHRFDFASGRPAPDPVVATPGFDFSGGLVSDRASGKALGVWMWADAATTVWFDERLKALQAEADRRLPGRVNLLACRRCDRPDMVALIHSHSDREPGDWIVYTAQDQRWRHFGRSRPAIEAARMGTLDFERFTARDGLSIPVWVTRPAASVAPRDKPLPTVVLVHGGPWVRGGYWDWNSEAQFLASRGYVVVEPEFRGSTGYGQEHYRAGWKQWGQAMQDDVADAAVWAASRGWTDPKRVCLAGGSYGGYATLMGLVRHGELFRCGAAWAAPTDLRLMSQAHWRSSASEEWRRHSMPQLIGDPKADAAMFEANSPVLRAAEINRPLLLAVGEEDWIVPREHSLAMRDALKRAGKPLEWVVYPDEGHGWNKFENRVDFYRRLERFLGEHLR